MGGLFIDHENPEKHYNYTFFLNNNTYNEIHLSKAEIEKKGDKVMREVMRQCRAKECPQLYSVRQRVSTAQTRASQCRGVNLLEPRNSVEEMKEFYPRDKSFHIHYVSRSPTPRPSIRMIAGVLRVSLLQTPARSRARSRLLPIGLLYKFKDWE